MTITERITKLESELQQCHAQLAQWNEARLRTEGALAILRAIVEEQNDENTDTNTPTTTSSSSPVSLGLSPGDVQ